MKCKVIIKQVLVKEIIVDAPDTYTAKEDIRNQYENDKITLNCNDDFCFDEIESEEVVWFSKICMKT